MGKGDQRAELTREELYALVWAEPMTKLARRSRLASKAGWCSTSITRFLRKVRSTTLLRHRLNQRHWLKTRLRCRRN